MKKIKNNKALLFENMARLNPEFKLNEGDDKWIQKAVDPEHKGYCTPMTKPTCTPRRKALAKRFKKGIDEATDRGSEIIYTFKTNAITEIQDSPNGKKYTHPVYLIKGEPKYAPIYDGVVLSISDTPGAWYVDTLMEGRSRYSDIIYIDFGQKWICSNWSEIMRELQEWISANEAGEREAIDENPEILNERLTTFASEIHREISKIPGLTRINFWSLANGFVGLYRYDKDGNAYEIEIRPVQVGTQKALWGNQIKKREDRNGQ